jgi:protein-L-isoaspartate(D-aspartate) O-methyltransferase
MNIEQARFNMVEQQIRPWNVLDAAVLHLLSVVKREDFVPAACKAQAFTDMEIPLGQGEVMLAPRVEARLLQDAAVKKHEKVLEIGAGAGYLTALLGHRAQHVLSLEINPELATLARSHLDQAGIRNAEVRLCDGAQGAPADGPFDVIVLGGSVAVVPQALLDQLKLGGRLIAVVGNEPMMYTTLITRTGETNFTSTQLWDTVLPRLHNVPEPSKFQF